MSINRDSVTVNGVPGAAISGAVNVDGASHIQMNNLRFTGPGQGIKVFGGNVDLGGVDISDNAEDGLCATQNAWVSLTNSEITGNGLSGMFVQRSEFDANNSEISGNASDGVLSDIEGHTVFRNTVIADNRRSGISLVFHSIAERLWTDESGAETAESVVIVAFLVITATAVFQGPVAGTLSSLAGSIGHQVVAVTESWSNHGAAVSSTATGNFTGGDVSAEAKINPGG